MLIRLIVPGEIARVEDLNTSLEAVLTRHGIDAGVRADVRLIVEELASNAIEYGGDGGTWASTNFPWTSAWTVTC